jgi:NAD-dependent SIR2 family protein deacetylase
MGFDITEPISEHQKNIITLFQGGIQQELFVRELYKFLNEKPENEILHPKLIELWTQTKSNFNSVRTRVPERIIEAIDNKISTLNPPIDKEIEDIEVKSNENVTFLLGAGASAPSGIPTVNRLLSELWNRTKKIGRDDLDNLAKFCREREIDNIEDLLTAAYISNFAVKNGNVNSLLSYFLSPNRRIPSEANASSISFLQDTLQTLFGLLASTMISAKPNIAHEKIVEFVKAHRKTSIITTNYDGCMDEAILSSGLIYNNSITDNQSDIANSVKLIKMHGSINWTYCDSCQNVQEFDLKFLKDTYENDKLSYPVLGMCKNCDGLRRPLLVPPLSFKILSIPKLIDLWNLAKEEIEKADYIIVVGYSFAEADTYITKIIARSMTMNNNQKMIIVDTDPTLVSVLRDRFLARINGFNERRILRVCISSEVGLPRIIDMILAKISAEVGIESISGNMNVCSPSATQNGASNTI